MELKLEVVLSSSIKRKKPWPRFCWLGQEKESVFLLDDKRISEINMVSGRTKKRTPKLQPLLNSVVTMAASQNGVWLAGLLASGELFLWNRDKDILKTATAVPEVAQLITAAQGKGTRLSLQVSGDGMRVLLVALTGQVCLWECVDVRDLTGVRDSTARGNWAQIQPVEDAMLPSSKDKEASQHSIFVKTEAVGDACLLAFVFTSGEKLTITCLKIQWDEGHVRRVGSVGYSVHWASKTYAMSRLTPPCHPVKSRGALVPVFSPDGQLLAIVLNQRDPRATQVVFISTQNFVSISSGLGGCGSKKLNIPSKYIRSYWVGSVSWAAGGLFLACVLKRGSLLMLSRLGGLLSLSSSGCNVDFGPAHFLPLHPLVTYRPPISARKGEASLSSSSMSARDVLRQRYSVTWHPRLFYLIVSDGYMVTVLRVPERPTPALLLKTLLQDTSKDLEKASRMLDKSQVVNQGLLEIHARAWLESVSCKNLGSILDELRPIVIPGSNTTEPATLPPFLQDHGTMNSTKELLQRAQAFFEDDSDLDGPPAGSHVEDSGHLEFASMFDTLHARLDTQTGPAPVTDPHEKTHVDSERKTPTLLRELGRIQGSLLKAWALGVSLGSTVEQRERLLKYTLHCVVRFAALLRLIPSSRVDTVKKNSSFSSRLLHLLKALLSFLPWDATHTAGPGCLGLVIELSKRLVHLLLSPHPESYQTDHSNCQLSSQSLSTALLILQLASDSLDHTYSLQQRTVWASTQQESLSQPPHLSPTDVYYVPLLQHEKKGKPIFAHQALSVPQRPSSRLLGVWQWVYRITQQYMKELEGFKGCDGWEEEQQQVFIILSQIQTALQATGERLEEGPALLSYPGEHLFLFGLYSKSADVWWSEIWAERNRNCDRTVFHETRLCLALLYGLLSQYRLREAQGLGDHMARLILHRAGHHKDNMTCTTADTLLGSWLPEELHSEAACAVVQTLGRFMASYFTNQPLYILPPHSVAVLPPLHLPHAPSVGRLVPLCQEGVAGAVRKQQLSEVWTVDYAQDLLLLGGLLPEAVWLARHLGDWKTAVSLGLAYTSYCTEHCDFTRLRWRELHLPTDLEPASIFQAQLECLIGRKTGSQETEGDGGNYKSFTDSLEGEDWELLQVSTQEILKASVMAGVNVMSSSLSALLDTAKDLSSCLPALVPSGMYLPAPPLYCPQPSPNTQDPMGTLGQLAEVASRHKVSGVLQRLLLLLRSARCCRPAAQWYISHLRRARHLLHKIKQKYSHPSAAEEEKPFPQGLTKFVTRSGFFRRGANGDGLLDPITIQTIICFRELCGLCWMLHVRDQLSVSCRNYQAARHLGRDAQMSGDSEVRSSCVDALHWTCRFLPFSRFLNAEEILQDILLSLVSELPPVPLVAETLVRAFPEEEESVRVPLREKYNSLLQRLRPCTVHEGEKEARNETVMMILIQDKLRQRRKDLVRLRRHLAPPELYLWEKEEEQEDRGSRRGMAMLEHLSLAASLSNSTLTDCGHPLVYSDGDTADNTSEPISLDLLSRPKTSSKRVKVRSGEDANRTAVKMDRVIQEESDSRPGPDKEREGQHNLEQPHLPVVGTWEFELEDEEYLCFLELFLSYVLEKDDADGGESGCEPPLLKGFGSQLRERELHSLSFDMLTTLRRRQRDGRHPTRRHGNDAPVFRAGCCYKPIQQITTPEPQMSSVWSEGPISRANHSVTSLPGLRVGKQQGLFGLRQQASMAPDMGMTEGHLGSEPSPTQNTVPCGQPSEYSVFGSLASIEVTKELQQGLDPKLEARFPELGRLLEWMVRWADRRVLLGHHGKKKEKERWKGDGGMAVGGVVIRIKASAPAVLIALNLLERRYTAALLGTDHSSTQIQVPETQWTVAPVLQPKVGWKLERESSVDTGYLGSANTPTAPLDHNPQQGELSISHTDESERGTSQKTLHDDQDQVAFEIRPSSSQQSFPDEPDVTPEKEEAPPPHLQPQSSTASAPTAVSTAPSQPLPTQTDPVRQLLNDELFKLVQLQQINFMSLMQVVGASFSNLPYVQQNTHLAQSNMNLSHPNVPSSCANNFLPQPNISVEMQPLLVQAEPPGSPFGKSKKLIPSSERLLTTIDPSQPIPSAHVVLPSNDDKQNISASKPLGLKLLQLHPPLLPHQSSSHRPPVQEAWGTQAEIPATAEPFHFKLSQYDQTTLKRAEEERRRESSVPRRHLNLTLYTNPPHDPTPRSAQPQDQASEPCLERSRGQEILLLPPALPPHRPLPTQGLRLLNLHAVPHSSTTFPKIFIPPSSRPSTVTAVPMGETSRIKLLHIEPEPEMMLPLAAPPAQVTHLIPMEELAGLSVGRQSAGEAGLQLLRVDPLTQSTAKATLSTSSNSDKRVPWTSFLIISVDLITYPVPNELKPSGSFDSLLTGQRLLDKAISTTAELHAFASTQKRPPQRHDAFTNTDPALSPDLFVDLRFATEPPVRDTGGTPREPEKNLDLEGPQFIDVIDLEDEAPLQDLPPCPSLTTQDAPATQPPSPTSAQLHLLAASVIRTAAAAPHPSVTVTEDSLNPATHPGIPEESPLPIHIEHNGHPVTITQQDRTGLSQASGAQETQSPGPSSAFSAPPGVPFSARLSDMDAQLAALQNIADHMEMEFANSRMPLPAHTGAGAGQESLAVPGRLACPCAIPVPSGSGYGPPSLKRSHVAQLGFTVNQGTATFTGDGSGPCDRSRYRWLRLVSPCLWGALRVRPPRAPKAPARDLPRVLDALGWPPVEPLAQAGLKWLSVKTAFLLAAMSAKCVSELHALSHGDNGHILQSNQMPVKRRKKGEKKARWEDETLGQTELSDILDELVREGALSPTDLDLSASQAADLRRRLDQQQSGGMLQRHVPSEDEKKSPLRTWMRGKQREKLADYQKQRERMREREYRPYSASASNAEVQGWPLSSENHRRRLGLHRPVSSLPRDRLSQVTRRGMLTDMKSKTKSHTANQGEELQRRHQGKVGLNKSPPGRSAVRRGEVRREQREMEEREVVSPWITPPKMYGLLGLEESEFALAGLLEDQEDGASGMQWLENLSESGGSILSQIDWAAIESMVATEGDI
ncbi:ciliogenesis and planar polarity effector 1 [Diretmus argenteus]